MLNRLRDITIKIHQSDEVYEINTYTGEYRNLMMLLSDKIYLDDFGECKGMGRCGTCLIEILKSKNSLPIQERNEETTIRKAGITNQNIRLACQLLIDEHLNNIEIRIVAG
ncbi:2Fe-2S iron-sulfur cluster-binding protein [Rubrolithibacter danxiaensis]|uniref:2Fe-2S iron-sulfur cluster-binding protein n=1 Tax=Rubrolithibacter danxiaensis TaxID=3390805 RepID=UPI003BF7733C